MNNELPIDISHFVVPGLFRRCAAIIYDILILFGVVYFAAALIVVPLGWLFGIEIESGNIFFQLYLCMAIFAFFAWFWVHGGQTLGMRAWRIRLIREDGGPLRWPDALMRFLSAILAWIPCGLGFIWLVFDKDKLTWYDRLSRTRPVLLKRPNDP